VDACNTVLVTFLPQLSQLALSKAAIRPKKEKLPKIGQ
jgi:hypothetical protein